MIALFQFNQILFVQYLHFYKRYHFARQNVSNTSQYTKTKGNLKKWIQSLLIIQCLTQKDCILSHMLLLFLKCPLQVIQIRKLNKQTKKSKKGTLGKIRHRDSYFIHFIIWRLFSVLSKPQICNYKFHLRENFTGGELL